MSGLLGEFVESQEGVGVSCCAVTQSVTFLQETSVPDHLTALHGIMQVLLLTEHLEQGEINMLHINTAAGIVIGDAMRALARDHFHVQIPSARTVHIIISSAPAVSLYVPQSHTPRSLWTTLSPFPPPSSSCTLHLYIFYSLFFQRNSEARGYTHSASNCWRI